MTDELTLHRKLFPVTHYNERDDLFFNVAIKTIKANCCDKHVHAYAIVRCEICKINVNVNCGLILESSTYDFRNTNLIDKLDKYHNNLHGTSHANERVIATKKSLEYPLNTPASKKAGAKGYAVKKRSTTSSVERSCVFCGEIYSTTKESHYIPWNKKRYMEVSLFKMAKFHLLYDCKKFADKFPISDITEYNSPQSPAFIKTMEIISKYNVSSLAANDPDHLDGYDGYFLPMIPGPDYVHTMLFDVKKTACGGEYLATCAVCGETRKFKDFMYAINFMYCQILHYHFHIPRKMIHGEVTDLVRPETMMLRSYSVRRPRDPPSGYERYCMDKSDYACIVCGMIYDTSAAVPYKSAASIIPASTIILDHFTECVKNAIMDVSKVPQMNFDPHNKLHDGSSRDYIPYGDHRLNWLVGSEHFRIMHDEEMDRDRKYLIRINDLHDLDEYADASDNELDMEDDATATDATSTFEEPVPF